MPDAPVCRAVVKVQLQDGLHLRPLTQLARMAQGFSATVTLHKGGQAVDAKRPLDLMTLAAACGEELIVEANGADADAAVAALVRLFESDFADGAP
jgi:phosphotransferase system HPr (HPr) family protein